MGVKKEEQMRILEILEPVFSILVFWVIVNIVHALLTMKEGEFKGAFFSISNAIKRDLGKGKK